MNNYWNNWNQSQGCYHNNFNQPFTPNRPVYNPNQNPFTPNQSPFFNQNNNSIINLLQQLISSLQDNVKPTPLKSIDVPPLGFPSDDTVFISPIEVGGIGGTEQDLIEFINR